MNTLEVYDRAIAIEKRLSNMYHRFSSFFKDNPEVHNFWTGVANHEKSHSEALTMSKGYLMWNHPSVRNRNNLWLEAAEIRELESIDVMLREYERMAKKKRTSLQEAIDILLNIENSELNHLYNRLIHISGYKLSGKPEDTYQVIHEHMKVIKTFVDKYYRGRLPRIRIDVYADRSPQEKTESQDGAITGKILMIEAHMSYGFIEGDNGAKYMFLPEDISQGNWKDAGIGRSVEFKVITLPWGPRAVNINIK